MLLFSFFTVITNALPPVYLAVY